jgi:hypothetical protein
MGRPATATAITTTTILPLMFHSPHEHLTLPFSPCQTNATDCSYTVSTCICIVLNFLTVTSLAVVLKLQCISILYASYSKCVENTFITEEFTTLSSSKIRRGLICSCSTRILLMLPVTVCSLFCVMIQFSNQGSSQ